MFPYLIIPGYTNSGPEHWQSLWQGTLPDCRRVEQRDWDHPHRAEWVETLDRCICAETTPPVLIAHSLGCLAVAHWASQYRRRLAGAFLVAPPDVERPDSLQPLSGFAPIPMSRLEFPSVVVASINDPFITVERAKVLAAAWGSDFMEVGEAGHLNTAAGYGAWPAGRELLERFVRGIRVAGA